MSVALNRRHRRGRCMVIRHRLFGTRELTHDRPDRAGHEREGEGENTHDSSIPGPP